MAAGSLRGLVCVFFVCCWCLAPKNALRHLRTTQDVRRRSVRGWEKVRLGVSLKRFAQVLGRVAYGARWAAGVGRT
eukprot:scaffold5316_cov105-Isochrysis_galbana.AAC.1